jgi:hypothetical protein
MIGPGIREDRRGSDLSSQVGGKRRVTEGAYGETIATRWFSEGRADGRKSEEKAGDHTQTKGGARRIGLHVKGLGSCQTGVMAGTAMSSPPDSTLLTPRSSKELGALLDVWTELLSQVLERIRPGSEGPHSDAATVTEKAGHLEAQHSIKSSINLHGRPMPVADLRRTNGRSEDPQGVTSVTAVCNPDWEVTGMVLGADWDIYRRTRVPIDLPPVLAASLEHGFAYGVARLGSRLLVWLEPSLVERR